MRFRFTVPCMAATATEASALSAKSGTTGIQNAARFIRPTGVPMNATKDSGGLRLHAGCTTKPSYTVAPNTTDAIRSEEHTSELQSHVNLVCRLLLEKKKK